MLSILVLFVTVAASTSASSSLSQKPRRDQRFKRLYTVTHGPDSALQGHQRQPHLRQMQNDQAHPPIGDPPRAVKDRPWLLGLFVGWHRVMHNFHVNGRGATAGCISAPRWFLRSAMARLDPARVPVIAIGR